MKQRYLTMHSAIRSTKKVKGPSPKGGNQNKNPTLMRVLI